MGSRVRGAAVIWWNIVFISLGKLFGFQISHGRYRCADLPRVSQCASGEVIASVSNASKYLPLKET